MRCAAERGMSGGTINRQIFIDLPVNNTHFPEYQLISKGKYCSNHGGLLIYVHNDYLWEPIIIKEQTTGWENLFIKVKHKSPASKIQ